MKLQSCYNDHPPCNVGLIEFVWAKYSRFNKGEKRSILRWQILSEAKGRMQVHQVFTKRYWQKKGFPKSKLIAEMPIFVAVRPSLHPESTYTMCRGFHSFDKGIYSWTPKFCTIMVDVIMKDLTEYWCPSVCKTPQQFNSLKSSSFIILHSPFLHFTTFKLFSLFT